MFPFVLSGCENEGKTSLSIPKELTVNNGIISFKQVDDAEYYSISVNDKVFSVDAKHNSNVTLIDGFVKYDANRLFAYGNTYSIKVKARGSEKYDSHYTAVVEYLHNIDLLAPENVKLSAKTLVWDNVNDATYYIVKAIRKINNITSENVVRCDINACDTTCFLIDSSTHENLIGEFQFSVKAVREGENPCESDFSNVLNYTNYIQLKAPSMANGKTIKQTNEGIIMELSNVDENANMLIITCGNVVVECQYKQSAYVKKSGSNYILNLTGIFGADKFVELKQYVFTVQAKFATVATTYFKESAVSEQFAFDKTEKLSTPILEVALDSTSGKFVAKWNAVANAVGYEILLDGILIFVDAATTEFMIEQNSFVIEVRAVGAGSYLTSEYSNRITK